MKLVTAGELNQMIFDQEPLFILDVRNEMDFADWKVEGKNIEYLNVPYFELIESVEPILGKLPTDRKIVVVCAKEGSSKMVAEGLKDQGISSYYLQGGMKTWSEYLYPVNIYQDDQMNVFQLIRVGKGCLSYVIVSGSEALVVDPSRFIDAYLSLAEQEGVEITHIVDSHLHADHISGGRLLAEKTGAKYYLMKSEGAVFEFAPLEQHDHIHFADVQLEVLAVKTPGHTPGSVSFLVNQKLLFSGDTIFVSGLGRPDLGGKVREWAKDLYHTVYEKVAHIADDVLVLPAHYANLSTELNAQGFIGESLGSIRQENEIMQGKEEDAFIDHVAASASTETPPNFTDIIAINRGTLTADEMKMSELEIGPNRCAVHHTN
ncbi:MBL fold metallo-hydrolase [Hazenella coriacea]|uniref:Glyoxylase-like metal-dependent hydrolase (Beta-lactamase superfamily II) n=1 Tax=Hazenella coriacea TaxID=1179467 RepID=A0A4R3L7K5_9BACL|nr:MBL fold metallo-hydrolase [Hazenella coriacea]TCS94194.1 glyoxylase-like metal-dependent hydrolase (beta-lactamase superfamily II) [Hazenella coriacea]